MHGQKNIKLLVVVNKHRTARVASCWFIIYYRLVMHGNSNIKCIIWKSTILGAFALTSAKRLLPCSCPYVLPSVCLSVSLSVRVYERGSH